MYAPDQLHIHVPGGLSEQYFYHDTVAQKLILVLLPQKLIFNMELLKLNFH